MNIQRDDNFNPIQGLFSLLEKKTVTFAAAITGAVGGHDLFVVTGDVIATVMAICLTDLTGSGNLATGVAGNANVILGWEAATDIKAHGIILATGIGSYAAAMNSTFFIPGGSDIINTIADATITAGQIDYYCFWRPLEASASVVAA